MAARDAGLREAHPARRARRGVLFLDRQQPGAVAQEALRRPDRAGLRRGRRHQRLQPDPRLARGRPGQLHPHRGGQAPAAGRRQSGSHAGLAGGNQARRAALHPPAQRPAPPVFRGQGEAAQRPQPEERRDHRAGRGLVADRQVAQDRDPARGGAGTGARGLPAVHRARRRAQGRKAQPVPRAGPALRLRPGHHAPPQRVPGTRRPGARRHPVQRRLLHPGDSARARGRRGGPLVRPPSGDLREHRSRPRRGARRGLLLLRALHRQRRAGARRPAADLLHRAGRAARRQVPGRLPGAARRRGGRGHRNR